METYSTGNDDQNSRCKHYMSNNVKLAAFDKHDKCNSMMMYMEGRWSEWFLVPEYSESNFLIYSIAQAIGKIDLSFLLFRSLLLTNRFRCCSLFQWEEFHQPSDEAPHLDRVMKRISSLILYKTRPNKRESENNSDHLRWEEENFDDEQKQDTLAVSVRSIEINSLPADMKTSETENKKQNCNNHKPTSISPTRSEASYIRRWINLDKQQKREHDLSICQTYSMTTYWTATNLFRCWMRQNTVRRHRKISIWNIENRSVIDGKIVETVNYTCGRESDTFS